MQRSTQRAGVQRSGQTQRGISVGVHKGVHLRLARFNAVQAGAQQINGPDLSPRQALSGLPGIELVKGNRVRRRGGSGHARQYVISGSRRADSDLATPGPELVRIATQEAGFAKRLRQAASHPLEHRRHLPDQLTQRVQVKSACP